MKTHEERHTASPPQVPKLIQTHEFIAKCFNLFQQFSNVGILPHKSFESVKANFTNFFGKNKAAIKECTTHLQLEEEGEHTFSFSDNRIGKLMESKLENGKDAKECTILAGNVFELLGILYR